MESFFDRYRNPMILGAVLLAQLLGLAIQVKRPLNPQHPDAGSVRLIRLWAATVVTPIERLFHAVGQGTRTAWHDYVNVGALRHENQALRDENDQLRIAQARLNEDANQAHRLQALLDFKEKFVSRTLAAQVVGASASEQSRVLYIDKGSRDGLQPGMAAISENAGGTSQRAADIMAQRLPGLTPKPPQPAPATTATATKSTTSTNGLSPAAKPAPKISKPAAPATANATGIATPSLPKP